MWQTTWNSFTRQRVSILPGFEMKKYLAQTYLITTRLLNREAQKETDAFGPKL